MSRFAKALLPIHFFARSAYIPHSPGLPQHNGPVSRISSFQRTCLLGWRSDRRRALTSIRQLPSHNCMHDINSQRRAPNTRIEPDPQKRMLETSRTCQRLCGRSSTYLTAPQSVPSTRDFWTVASRAWSQTIRRRTKTATTDLEPAATT